MSFSRFDRTLKGVTAVGCLALYAYFDNRINPDKPSFFNRRVIKNSWTTNTNPTVKWNYNWDHRDPSSLVKPSNGTPEDDNRYNKEIEAATPTTVRHVVLIRHGQYMLTGKTDKERFLTELGRKQAEATGKRLRELGTSWDSFVNSTMTRAIETADIINSQLDQANVKCKRTECSLLEEGAPAVPEPPVGHWKPEPYKFYQEGARIEAAFRKHLHRASPSQTNDSYVLIVCHANVIRYFICRVMQFPPEAWLRISLNHASITWISVLADGRVVLRSLGDTGHMDPKQITSRRMKKSRPKEKSDIV